MNRKPIPLDFKLEDCNNNNLHQYSPYVLQDDNLIIDKHWFESLTPYCKRLITLRLKNEFKLNTIQIPHEHQIDSKTKQLATIYQAYIDSFDYHVWYNPYLPNGPVGTIMIVIPDLTKKVLIDVYEKKSNINDPKVEKLKRKIEKKMMPNTQYFVRLSSTSGKNEKAVKPFTNVNDILQHISSVTQFVIQEYNRDKDTYLILIPWEDKIDPRCEFRIFVVDGRLTAASPQRYWELHQYSQEELESFEYALTNIQFINRVPYKTFVADVYIDVQKQTCHLIELNPFGASSGAGASLFNWETDYNLLYGIKQEKSSELRYLSAINY